MQIISKYSLLLAFFPQIIFYVFQGHPYCPILVSHAHISNSADWSLSEGTWEVSNSLFVLASGPS